MFTLVCILSLEYVRWSNSQDHVIISPDKPHPLDIEPLVINMRIPDIQMCEEMNIGDCESLFHQMLKCEEIIFNDPGFSYQEYKENINVHREILAKYQSICDDTHSNYLVNELFDFKKD